MFETFRLRYPVLNILCFSIVFALLFSLLASLSSENRPLPTPSVMAFLLALGCLSLPVHEALILERGLPDCPPYWRVRYGVVMASWFFIFFNLWSGSYFPSSDALISFVGTMIFGAGIMWTSTWMAPVPDLFNTDQPVLHSRFSQSLWLVWGGIQLLIALGLSLIDIGGTALSVYIMVTVSGLVLPFGFRNHTRWRERDMLTVLGIAAATAGLFLA